MEVPSRLEIDDELWAEVEPLIPARPRRRRKPTPIGWCSMVLHVLHTEIAWRDLPQEYGYGCGVTAWRRLRDWQETGVWDALHRHLLTRLNAAGAIDWSRAAVDGSHVRALLGAPDGAVPVDRSRTGSKHHLLVDATGSSLAPSPAAIATTHPTHFAP
jgi:transposase